MQDPRVSRRSFLIGAGATAGTLALTMCRLGERQAGAPPSASSGRPTAATEPFEPVRYGDFTDLWREHWTWDRVVHSSHARANCGSACSWNIFVKDGIAWREEQNAIYAASVPGVPDFNPRGCQKGCCYTDLMYEPSRIVHPLRRAGERGSGKWKRISWDEALRELADAIIDASVSQDTGAVLYDHGTTNLDFGPDTAGEMRLFQLLNSTTIDSWAGVGDMPHGLVQTWGMYNAGGTSDDLFKSDFIVVWCCNPSQTMITDMHFMHEVRYRGGRLLVIAPDFSPTAVHADYWLNPRVGTDSALALAMAQVILSEGLHDEEYLREQTDLPILVREDTGRYLRESDLRENGSEELFHFWDSATDRLAEVPGCVGEGGISLALGALRPALTGRREVRLHGGTSVGVRPLLDVLRNHLDREYTPEQSAGLTGVGAKTIRRMARELAAAPRAMIFPGVGSCKHYHGDLMQRSQILLMVLTGNQGKSGGGLRIASWWPVEGFSKLSNPDMGSSIPWAMRLRLLWRMLAPSSLWGGFGWRHLEQLMQDITSLSGNTPLMPFLYVHAGYAEVWDRKDFHDPAAPRPTSAYMREAVDKGWIQIRPRPGTEPRVFVFTGANPLRRWPAPQIARKHLWPKLEMIVDVNTKASTSGIHADLILPTSGYYERDSLKYPLATMPYLILCEQAVPPLGESKPEWEIFGLLARKIQDRARERGVSHVTDSVGGKVDLSKIYDDWTDDGKFHESNPRAVLDWILRETSSTGKKGFAEAETTGVLPVLGVSGRPNPMFASATDYEPGRTLYPHAAFIEEKQAWPTLTGRQQFLIDHPWFEEIGESLPTHKEAPEAGGSYPLRLTGGHTRWSIHATWRDSSLMLRLQRGEPSVWISDRDARERSVADGDRVRVFNDVGEFEAIAKVAAVVQPGQTMIYHAWEPYQFRRHRGSQEPVPAPWKPAQLAGGYGQLHYRMVYNAPGHTPRGQRVQIERV